MIILKIIHALTVIYGKLLNSFLHKDVRRILTIRLDFKIYGELYTIDVICGFHGDVVWATLAESVPEMAIIISSLSQTRRSLPSLSDPADSSEISDHTYHLAELARDKMSFPEIFR